MNQRRKLLKAIFATPIAIAITRALPLEPHVAFVTEGAKVPDHGKPMPGDVWYDVDVGVFYAFNGAGWSPLNA